MAIVLQDSCTPPSSSRFVIIMAGALFSILLGVSESVVLGQTEPSTGMQSRQSSSPPAPQLDSGLQYFGGSEIMQDTHGGKTPDSQGAAKSHPPESPYVGDEGIPVMKETVVEGSSIDSFADPFDVGPQKPVNDPWEPFNAEVFQFNYNLDRYVIKPVAKGYNTVVPPDVQGSLANAFNNMGYAVRLLNTLLQGKYGRAGIETKRFLINTTIGVGGLFDVAKHAFNTEAPPVEDTGQTLAFHGFESGPYLVLPLLPPLTVRDAVGYVGDIFLNPINYFLPIFPNLGMNAEKQVNNRSLNLERFQGIEESTVDLYGAVRSGYLQRRAKEIAE